MVLPNALKISLHQLLIFVILKRFFGIVRAAGEGKTNRQLLPSCTLFKLLKHVEFYVTDFGLEGDVYQHSAFQEILYTICVNNLPKVGCDLHFM